MDFMSLPEKIQWTAPIRVSITWLSFALMWGCNLSVEVENGVGGSISSSDGHIDCPSTSCSHDYKSNNTSVTLSAKANEGYGFAGFKNASSCANGNDNSLITASCSLDGISSEKLVGEFINIDEVCAHDPDDECDSLVESDFEINQIDIADNAVSHSTVENHFLRAASPENGYSHEASMGYRNPNWMSTLSDSNRLSEISVPGTHNSLSLHGGGFGDIVKTQTMTLAEQLQSGIRAVDIRLHHIDDSFAIHHGRVFQEAFFGRDVMEPIINFLDQNPRETVLMRVSEEHDPAGNTRQFWETFEWYMSIYGAKVWNRTSNNPTLREIRGKIVILQYFSDANRGDDYGIHYRRLNIQDDYNLNTNWDLYEKWEKVKGHIEKAENGSRNTIYMNYLSGSGGALPYFVASGHSKAATDAPRLWTGRIVKKRNKVMYDFPRKCGRWLCRIFFEGTNELSKNYILARKTNFTGIMMSDFPGGGLIDSIIKLNN